MDRVKIAELIKRLDDVYGTSLRCFLHYEKPWQLLIAVILSAQCTDERVNLVTKDLFRKYRTPAELAAADIHELERDIYATGFYHNKAKNIKACAAELTERYGGDVPRSLEELTALPGVGRKTANVIRGNIYGDASVVVDTHVKRIANRLGLTGSQDPVKVEFDLMDKLPKDHWILCNLDLITLGRTVCTARSPKCGECFLRDICPSAASGGK